ncbi:PREDICTED: C-X-C motif chemokine 16 [Capra hircus]|uniref:C-X-C motif chemokine 16 n=1 Tax=Capra hircus TaxID=9925 RepID=A0A8C2Y334_CAPHI|nr:PREDICTED: C-X-C motif chemokine 16 [Capra hircus]
MSSGAQGLSQTEKRKGCMAKREKEAKAIEKPAGRQAPENVGESDRTRRAEMMLGRASRLLLVLLFVACLTPSGNGNEGSKVGRCPCNRTIPSRSPPKESEMSHLRKYLTAYQRCFSYIRFQLPRGTVCGGSTDRWVQELMRCFDSGECRHAQPRVVTHQAGAPLHSTQLPEPTEAAPSDTATTSQMYLPSTLQRTQQPTPLEGALSLDSKLIPTHETTTYASGHSLGAEPEARENQKQLKENMGPAAGTLAMVPVLSLLAIVFILTGVLLYVVCKRRRKQPLQHPPDLAASLYTCSRRTSAQNGIL